MYEFLQLLTVNLATVLGLMCLLWLVSLVRRDASVVDPFWGTGFVLVVWLSCLQAGTYGCRPLLLAVLTTVWGLRISSYLLWRNWGRGEDRRYRAMREKHGSRFWLVSLGTVFLLQGAILWFVSLPLQAGVGQPAPAALWWLDLVGCGLWTQGFAFEVVGDWQLARFTSDPDNRGRVLDRGLWRYTRHPNYFGDFCVWWGLFLVAAAAGAWWTLPSPLLMSLLLMRVSGVPLLERDIAERRAGYADYVARTSAFFPAPPRPEKKAR
jgi:steroid 5-alpha reductase family enzyme